MASYFKIVQTEEDGEFELAVVPSAWEEKGMLQWPKIDNKKKKASGLAIAKLVKDLSSIPSQDWIKSKCTLKRTNFLTYEEAEKELEAMMLQSDTSGNEDATSKMPPPNKRRVTAIVAKKNGDSGRNNFNCMVDTLNNSHVIASPINKQQQFQFHHAKSSQTLPQLHPNQWQPVVYLTHQPAAQESNNTAYAISNSDGPSRTSSILSAQVSNSNDSALTAENIDNSTLFAMLKALIEDVAALHTKLDQVNEKMEKLATKQNAVKAVPTSLDAMFKRIDTDEKLVEFNEKLNTDPAYASDLHEKLKQHCGENSMRGDNAAYELIDVFFDRKLMTKYSWTGQQKKGHLAKSAFKGFTHVYRFVYELVKKADPTYSEVDMENFFKKKWLPNTERRSIAPQLRISRSKCRAKRLPIVTTIDSVVEYYDDENRTKENLSVSSANHPPRTFSVSYPTVNILSDMLITTEEVAIDRSISAHTIHIDPTNSNKPSDLESEYIEEILEIVQDAPMMPENKRQAPLDWKRSDVTDTENGSIKKKKIKMRRQKSKA